MYTQICKQEVIPSGLRKRPQSNQSSISLPLLLMFAEEFINVSVGDLLICVFQGVNYVVLNDFLGYPYSYLSKSLHLNEQRRLMSRMRTILFEMP